MYLFYKTLKDIGFKRVFLRIKYEIRKKIESNLTYKNRFNFLNINEGYASWNLN